MRRKSIDISDESLDIFRKIAYESKVSLKKVVEAWVEEIKNNKDIR